MYRAFYGLREKPFNLTPDPRFLYLSDKHKEAFAHLLYGIRSRSGFVMVTGEIGTGKTTICRNLLNQLDEDTELAFIFNPMLSPLELLKKIVSEFGVDSAGTNALEITEDLNQYLLEAAAKGKNCVLLIDEAQNLDPQVLEQIRLLSNLETETEKLLQIVLIGQPELGDKLALHELRQLNQRIAARYHLRPLSEKEVLQYVAYRLHVAGGRRKVKFARGAVRAVYKISGGTPRMINAVCDRALLIGFTKEVHTITASIVNRAYREIRGDDIFGKNRARRSFGQLIWNPITGIAAVVLVAIAFANSPVLRDRTRGYLDQMASYLPEAKPVPAPVREIAPVEETPSAPISSDVAGADEVPAPDSTAAAVLTSLPPSVDEVVETVPDALKQLSAEEALQSAVKSMLAAWNKVPIGELPTSLDEKGLADFARDNGLAIEFLNPALDQLLALDLPAIVQFAVDDTVRTATLTAAKENTLTLSSDATQWTIERGAFREIYEGNAYVFWTDPSPNASALLPGAKNSNVQSLRKSLVQLGRLDGSDNADTYDGVLSKAVARLQAETSLEVDGIAGKQVRMVLQSWEKPDGIPGLSAPTKAREVTVASADVPKATAPAEELPAPAVETKTEANEQADGPKAGVEVAPTPEAVLAPEAASAPEPTPVAEAPEAPVVPQPEISPTEPEPSTPPAEPEVVSAPPVVEEAPTPAPVTLTNVGDVVAPTSEANEVPLPTEESTAEATAPDDSAAAEVSEGKTVETAPVAPPVADPPIIQREEIPPPEGTTSGSQITIVELPDPGFTPAAPPPEVNDAPAVEGDDIPAPES